MPAADSARSGRARDGPALNLDKTHAFQYTFQNEASLQNKLSGRVPQSP